MKTVHKALALERNELLDFLEIRGLLANIDLIGQLCGAFVKGKSEEVYGCRKNGELAGVLLLVHGDCESWGFDYMARSYANDTDTMSELLSAVPSGRTGYFRVHQPALQQYFDTLTGSRHEHVDLHFTVDRAGFRPVSGERVVELRSSDSNLFEGCEGWAKNSIDRVGQNSLRVFAVVRAGRAVASALVGPSASCENREWEIIGIADVYTEDCYRRQGIGKRLVSYITEIVLDQNCRPVYWTTPDNVASQALVKSLGYEQYGTTMDYLWVKP